MRKLFIKSFVIPFYKAFFGFFILVFICFGMLMEIRQHVMIGEKILDYPMAFSILLFLFSVYGWIQYRFHVRLIQGDKYKLFHQMALLNKWDFFSNQLTVWVYNHLMLLVYAVFLTILSFNHGYLAQAILLWILLTSMFLLHKNFLFSNLERPFPNKAPILSKTFTSKNFQIKREYWLIFHLKENRLLLLIVSKVINLILLKLFFYSYSTGAYDERWLRFGLLCAACINLPIWLEKIEFEQISLKVFLNLPRNLNKKIAVHFYSTLQIIAPEILFISMQIPSFSNALEGFGLLILLFSINLLLIALINFTSKATNLTRNAFGVFFICFFLIIYGFPPILMSILGVGVFFKSIHSPYLH